MYEVEVRWLPFLLRDNIPLEGKLKEETDPKKRAGKRLREGGAKWGVDFTGLCGRVPNTVRAHMMTDLALKQGGSAAMDSMAMRCLHAYFTAGEDVSDVENLMKWGKEIFGLVDSHPIRSELSNPQAIMSHQSAIVSKQREARVTGVPHFFIKGPKTQVRCSGALEPEAFLNFFREVA